jgi:hypothetical protein
MKFEPAIYEHGALLFSFKSEKKSDVMNPLDGIL